MTDRAASLYLIAEVIIVSLHNYGPRAYVLSNALKIFFDPLVVRRVFLIGDHKDAVIELTNGSLLKRAYRETHLALPFVALCATEFPQASLAHARIAAPMPLALC
jgi:hypothetical protein